MSHTSVELETVLPTNPTVGKTHGATRMADSVQVCKTSLNQVEEPSAQPSVNAKFDLSKFKMTLVIINVTSVEFLRSVVEGMVVVQLPTIAPDIGLDRGLLLWSVSIFSPMFCFCICVCHRTQVGPAANERICMIMGISQTPKPTI